MFKVTEEMTPAQLLERIDRAKMNGTIVKIGSNIQLLPEEAEEAVNRCLYIVAYRTIWSVKRSENAGYYGRAVIRTVDPMTRRGRYYSYTAQQVNNLLGEQALQEVQG